MKHVASSAEGLRSPSFRLITVGTGAATPAMDAETARKQKPRDNERWERWDPSRNAWEPWGSREI